MTLLRDKHQRTIDYMRVSVTDRCNVRCVYCMPKEGVASASHDEILTDDEILRVCNAAVRLGVKRIKLTGGEPLVRRNMPILVKELKAIPAIEEVTLTTNGILLADYLEMLVDYGIDGINISLDTINRQLYQEITRFDGLDQVLENIDRALSYDSLVIKVNCVPISWANQDFVKLAYLAKERAIHVRFIEMMPIGYGKGFQYVSEEEIKQQISEKYGPIIPVQERLGNGPSQYYEVIGFRGKIGFISAMSHQFCHRCNRIRLTSQGRLKTCLQYETGADLKMLLRNGVSEDELVRAMQASILEKPKEHGFTGGQSTANREPHEMVKIGG